jgi:2'-5' RNA ligase
MAKLKQKISCRNWQPIHQLHITVHFFGEVDQQQLPVLTQIMEKTCQNETSFPLKLGRLGAFSRQKNSSVIWVGVDGELNSLFALEKKLRTKLIAHGFSLDDKRYKPHITIARNANDKQLPDFPVNPLTWTVDRILLFHSTLTPHGAIHTPIATFLLNDKMKEKGD